MRFNVQLGAVVLSLAFLTACARERGTPPGLVVRAVPATLRVTRTQAIANEASSVRLSAAKNEVEPFQLVIRAEHAPFKNIDVVVSDLKHAKTGSLIRNQHIQLFREYFLYVLQPSGGFKWIPRIEYPGPLLPFDDPYSPGSDTSYGAPFDHTRIGSVGQAHRKDHFPQGFLFPAGHYTGHKDRRYVVQIDQGGDAGIATFRWSDTWRKGTDAKTKVWRWNARNVPIPPMGADRHTPPVTLNNGVQVWFAAGKEPHFEKHQSYHFNVYASMNEVVWGDVHVPANAKPGIYNGTVTVQADGEPVAALPIELTVHPFSLPRERSIVTAFGGWMVHDFYADCPDADIRFEKLLHQHRIDRQNISGHRTEWVGRFGNMDWSSFDAAASPRLDGSIYPDGAPQKAFSPGMYGCGNEWQWKGHAGESIDNVRIYGKLFAEHFKKKGWFDRVWMYCRDEPYPQHIPGIIRDIKAFLEGDPDWAGKFMVTSMPRPDSPLLDWIDIWCVKYHWFIDPTLEATLRKQGKKFWCYAANAPYSPNPTYHLDNLRGYEARIIKWASWLRGAEGFLYWAMALDQEYPNPWTTPMNDFGACGDANLVYYGARNGARLYDNATPLRPIMGPVPGFRLKQIREGLEDWEYLLMCERLRGRSFTEGIAREVYRSPGGPYGKYTRPDDLEKAWTQDPRKIYAAREKLAEAIIEGTK